MNHADLYDDAAAASRRGLKKARRAARHSLIQLSEGVEDLQDAVAPVLRRARSRAADASGRTLGYVREEPVRSALAVVAVGTLVYALARLLSPRNAH